VRRLFISILVLCSFAVRSSGAEPKRYEPDPRQVKAADAFIHSREIIRNPRKPAENRMEYRDARSYAFGDVTGDRIPDLVVQFTLEEGNNWSLHAVVLAGPELRKSWVARVGGKGWRNVDLDEVVDEGIDFTSTNYAPEDAICCPSIEGSATFYLIEDGLEETEALIDCGGEDDSGSEMQEENGTLASMRTAARGSSRRLLRHSVSRRSPAF